MKKWLLVFACMCLLFVCGMASTEIQMTAEISSMDDLYAFLPGTSSWRWEKNEGDQLAPIVGHSLLFKQMRKWESPCSLPREE